MTPSTEADEAILATLARFGPVSFSTKNFIDEYRSLYPSKWKAFEAAFGKGGKGSGRYFSANSLMSQTLQRMHVAGRLKKLDYRPSPPGWGSHVIRYWTLDPNGESGTFYPDELEPGYEEGPGRRVFVNKYERNTAARFRCIQHYGAVCQACDLDFEKRYGSHGAGFIHVHHLKPMHTVEKAYLVDAIRDLRPVCPNCHSMIHLRSPMLGIAELRAIIAANAK